MSDFTTSCVQCGARRETGDSRAVTSMQERWSREFCIPLLFCVCREKELRGRKYEWDC